MYAGAGEDNEEDEGGNEVKVLANGADVNHAGPSNAECMTINSRPVKISYKPAYELEDETAERLGRDR